MELIFWIIVVIILLCSVSAWFNTKIILEDLAKIQAVLKMTKKKRKVMWRRSKEIVSKRLIISKEKGD